MERKLLILTQKIDRNDPVLGFFHNWVANLATGFPHISVVCLEQGDFDLPQNVSVHSLGKEKKHSSKLAYSWRFLRTIWKLRKEYDAVFVHMNQEYVLLAGLLWIMLGKKVFMWRNHSYGNLLTRIAAALSDGVFATSEHSFVAQFEKTRLMPAGIDTDHFKPHEGIEKVGRSVLSVGRISPSKHIDVLVEAADTLWTEGTKFRVSIVGDAAKGSEAYYSEIRAKSTLLEREGVVTFYDAVTQDALPELYSSHEVFVNMTESGSFDKTVLEAIVCGVLPVASNMSFRTMFPAEYRDLLHFSEGDSADLAAKISTLLVLPAEKKKEIAHDLREVVIEKHSLKKLVEELIHVMNE